MRWLQLFQIVLIEMGYFEPKIVSSKWENWKRIFFQFILEN